MQPSELCAAAWFMCGTQLKPSQHLKSSVTRNQAGGKGKKKSLLSPLHLHKPLLYVAYWILQAQSLLGAVC